MSALRALAMLLALLFAGPAFAHASLVMSHPTEGAVLPSVPAAVQLRFNEPVTPITVRLLDSRGSSHELQAHAAGDTVDVSLPPGLPNGTQLLSYRIVSADGHPVGASLTFSIGKAGATAARAPQRDLSRAAVIWGVNAAILGLLLGGIGLLVFFAFICPVLPPPNGRWWTARCVGLCTGLVLLSTGLQGLDLLDWPARQLVGSEPWLLALRGPFGLTIAGELVALALTAGALSTSNRRQMQWLAGLALVAAGIARAASGHAANADPQWLTRPAIFLHTTAVAIWIGALPGLLWMALKQQAIFPQALQRFSSIALISVEVLVVTGLFVAVVQLHGLGAIVETSYGLLFVAKMLLVAGLLALAGWNRINITPRILAGEPRASVRLARTVALEMLLVGGVLGVVAGWRFTPPPRAMAAAHPPELLHLHGEKMMAMVQFEPGRPGENRVRVDLLDPEFQTLVAKEVTVAASSPAMGVEQRSVSATRSEDGVWRARLYLPARGEWSVQVDALVSDFEKLSIEGSYRMKP